MKKVLKFYFFIRILWDEYVASCYSNVSAILKKEGHQVEIFDTTYYATDHGIDSDGSKMEKLNVVPYKMDKTRLINTSDWRKDLNKKILDYKPDLIAISSTEDMWELATDMLTVAKEYKLKNKVPVVVGGVFATFAPDICMKNDLVDLVCVGEGENALLDLCKKIKNKEDFSDVTNLWVKQNKKIISKNPITKPVDINNNPIIDISLFEEKRLYRPMAGKVYKMIPIETIRGCPFTCRFCNSPDQMALYKGIGANFYRKKEWNLFTKN